LFDLDGADLDSFLFFFTNEKLCGSSTNLITEWFPLSLVIVSNSGIDFIVDVFTVDDEVFTNVVGKAPWGLEGSDHTGHLTPISLDVGAVRHVLLDTFKNISNVFESSDDV